MNYFNKLKQFHYYIWVYIIGAILTFINGKWIQNTFLTYLCLAILYCILFFKGIHILFLYKKASKKKYPIITKKKFTKQYRPFRMKVFLFILAFLVLCVLGKFVLHLNNYYFYSCTFFSSYLIVYLLM